MLECSTEKMRVISRLGCVCGGGGGGGGGGSCLCDHLGALAPPDVT